MQRGEKCKVDPGGCGVFFPQLLVKPEKQGYIIEKE